MAKHSSLFGPFIDYWSEKFFSICPSHDYGEEVESSSIKFNAAKTTRLPIDQDIIGSTRVHHLFNLTLNLFLKLRGRWFGATTINRTTLRASGIMLSVVFNCCAEGSWHRWLSSGRFQKHFTCVAYGRSKVSCAGYCIFPCSRLVVYLWNLTQVLTLRNFLFLVTNASAKKISVCHWQIICK
jgi:hypothetical protein